MRFRHIAFTKTGLVLTWFFACFVVPSASGQSLTHIAARPEGKPAAAVTLDTLDNDVTSRGRELCEELESASADRVAALKADYTQYRQEEVKRLDAMRERQKALAALRKELVADSAKIDSWDHMPAGDPRLKRTEATLKAARDSQERLDFERRQLQEQNATLVTRRDTFAAASVRLRGAIRKIADLTAAIERIDSGESASSSVVGALGARRWAAHNRSELQRELTAAEQTKTQALHDASEVLYLARPPQDIGELAAKAAPLHREWQALQDKMRRADAGIAAAKDAVEAALKARDETRSIVRAERRQALAELQASIKTRTAEYASQTEGFVADRIAAILSFKLYSNVWDCIKRREAALKEGKKKQVASRWKLRFSTIKLEFYEDGDRKVVDQGGPSGSISWQYKKAVKSDGREPTVQASGTCQYAFPAEIDLPGAGNPLGRRGKGTVKGSAQATFFTKDTRSSPGMRLGVVGPGKMKDVAFRSMDDGSWSAQVQGESEFTISYYARSWTVKIECYAQSHVQTSFQASRRYQIRAVYSLEEIDP